ncbi:hypothetical protein VNO78_12387 [Psophocarpus tetragonolobus]|uniref:Uncharacterized protein n=1 Tax=Psophocarpus tetragonolobus TaxID=3891 RepID=A0AAN9SMX4_PSOTE
MTAKDPSLSLYLSLEIISGFPPHSSKPPSPRGLVFISLCGRLRDIISPLVESVSSIFNLIFSTAMSFDLGDIEEFAFLLWSMWRSRNKLIWRELVRIVHRVSGSDGISDLLVVLSCLKERWFSEWIDL